MVFCTNKHCLCTQTWFNSIVFQNLLKTHPWATLLHRVTCSMITKNKRSAAYLKTAPQTNNCDEFHCVWRAAPPLSRLGKAVVFTSLSPSAVLYITPSWHLTAVHWEKYNVWVRVWLIRSDIGWNHICLSWSFQKIKGRDILRDRERDWSTSWH